MFARLLGRLFARSLSPSFARSLGRSLPRSLFPLFARSLVPHDIRPHANDYLLLRVLVLAPLAGPLIDSANYTSSTSINISWSPVPEPLRLGIITKYIFTLTDVLTGVVTTAEFNGPNLHGEVTNLSKYREYNIAGAAANSKGQSNFTSTVTCRTGEDGE